MNFNNVITQNQEFFNSLHENPDLTVGEILELIEKEKLFAKTKILPNGTILTFQNELYTVFCKIINFNDGKYVLKIIKQSSNNCKFISLFEGNFNCDDLKYHTIIKGNIEFFDILEEKILKLKAFYENRDNFKVIGELKYEHIPYPNFINFRKYLHENKEAKACDIFESYKNLINNKIVERDEINKLNAKQFKHPFIIHGFNQVGIFQEIENDNISIIDFNIKNNGGEFSVSFEDITIFPHHFKNKVDEIELNPEFFNLIDDIFNN